MTMKKGSLKIMIHKKTLKGMA